MSSEVSANEILEDVNVAAAMRRVYRESDVGGDFAVEQGGFIVAGDGGAFSVERVAHGRPSSLGYPLCPDGSFNGRRIVGTFHTHPNTGDEWMQEPGRQDIRLSTEYPETMGAHQFVISFERIYVINNDGAVSDAGATRQLLNLEIEET